MKANKSPLRLRPSGKDYLWGGTRLNDDFGKNIPLDPLAETWECSTHPDGPSYVVGGEYDGWPLVGVLKENPDWLGRHENSAGELPILIKLIDAKKDLSVQVHPSDEYAAAHENGQRGKTEMWYVVDAAPGASLVCGLSQDVDADTLRAAIEDGSLETYLQKLPVARDDFFFIPSGTVHAIGAGALIAEVQENSNLTYRLYDYNRVDKNGKKRELHVDKALAVAELSRREPAPAADREKQSLPGMTAEALCRCDYFRASRLTVNTERGEAADVSADADSFRVLLVLGGCGLMDAPGSSPRLKKTMRLKKGDCIFIPAGTENVTLFGVMQLLDVRG